MAEAAPTTTAAAPQLELRAREVLIIAAVALILIDVAFLVLCRQYYLERYKNELPDIRATMAWERTKDIFFWSFCTFSVVGVGAVSAAALYPRYVTHALTTAFGMTYVAAAVMTWRGSMPALVGFAEILIGGLLLVLTWVSWQKKDRAAWAFL